MKTLFPCLASFDLVDKGNGDSKIRSLIGADFYWYITEGELRRLSSDGCSDRCSFKVRLVVEWSI